MCISVSKVPKTLENKGFFLDTDKNLCVSAPEVHPLSFCGSRINLYTVNIQYTDRPLKAFIYKEKYGKISIEK